MIEKRRLRIALAVVIAALAALALACVFFTACGDTTPKFAMKWETGEYAEVTVAGYDSLPSEVAENTELTITVKGKSGYNVAAVKINGKAIAGDANGVYKFTVGADTSVTVEVSKEISSVAVKTKPTKLKYYAGEKLDKTGMTVEVNYATGDKETVTDYAIVYGHGDAFAIGDTSFAVSYKKTTSAAVDLDSAVECLVVLDPDGGMISDAYYAELGANAALHDLAKAEDGTVSFTFAALESALTLPSAEQMSKGEEGDFTFRGWSDGQQAVTAIAADTSVSTTVKAVFDAQLLVIDTIFYENRTVTENDAQVSVPYLIIGGEFKAAKTAYLYLYEGNDKVELVGDTIGDENTQKGDPFELTFDMRKLVAKDYKGKWMDIKFRAMLGEREEQMEINLANYPENFVDLEQVLVNGDYFYSFETYANTLKAVYSDFFLADYTMTAGVNEANDPTVTFDGRVDATYAGKTVLIDFEIGDKINEYSVISADGTWSVTFDLDANRFPLKRDGYAHFYIVESEEDPTVIYQGNPANLLNTSCRNIDLEKVSVGLIENKGAIRCAVDDTRVYYVGKGKWGGIVIYGIDETIAQTGITLELKNEKPYLVISGTYNPGWTVAEASEKIKTEMCGYVDFTNCDPINQGGWTTYTLSLGAPADGDTPAVPETVLVEVAEGNWKIYLDLSVGNAGEVLFAHYGASDAAKANLESDNITKTTITANGIQYRTDVFTGWGSNLAVVYIETPAAA